jgi:hypothetical protein
MCREDQLPHELLQTNFYYIVGSDIIYEEDALQPLVNVLHMLSHHNTTILIAFSRRIKRYEELFFQLLQEKGFTHEVQTIHSNST